MNRYEIQNAAFLVDGYFLPQPHEGTDKAAAFERAKGECVAALAAQIQNIEALKPEEFFDELKRRGVRSQVRTAKK